MMRPLLLVLYVGAVVTAERPRPGEAEEGRQEYLSEAFSEARSAEKARKAAELAAEAAAARADNPRDRPRGRAHGKLPRAGFAGFSMLSPGQLRRLRRAADAGNGALLLLSAPMQFRIVGLGGLAAIRGLVMSFWLSLLGTLLLVDQVRLPFLRRWLRRHFRFVTTSSGRVTLQLFAATIALTSGSWSCAIAGLVTIANTGFGFHLRDALARMQPPAPQMPPKIAAPTSLREDEQGTTPKSNGAVHADESG